MADFDIDQIIAHASLESHVLASPHNGNWNGRGNVYCPFHPNQHRTPSLTVYRNNQTWKCWSCGKKGNVIHWVGYIEYGDGFRKGSNFQDETYKAQLLRIVAILTGKEVGTSPKAETRQLQPIEEKEYELWVTEDDYLDWTDTLWYYKDARIEKVRQWLQARGISREWAEHLRIGWTGDKNPKLKWYEKNRISLCWFAGGKLVGVRLRADPFGHVDEDHKYISVTGSSFRDYLYNMDCCFNSYPFRIISESELDVAAICTTLDEDCAVGRPASNFDPIHAMTLIGKTVYALNDADEAGMKQNLRISQLLKRSIIGSLPNGCKDVGEAMKLGVPIPIIEHLKRLKTKNKTVAF